ncbi:hypothetical protein A4G19_06995 [Pasteurellaceae bacterium Macca]|nr:hypothetical protein [Pasteurellaceae bacterium Macca]
MNVLLFCYNILIFLVTLSLTVRRLHDLGWSGWWLLLLYSAPLVGAIPLILTAIYQSKMPQSDPADLVVPLLILAMTGIAVLVVQCLLFFKDGQRFDNQYGVDPKAVSTGNGMTVTA